MLLRTLKGVAMEEELSLEEKLEKYTDNLGEEIIGLEEKVGNLGEKVDNLERELGGAENGLASLQAELASLRSRSRTQYLALFILFFLVFYFK